MIVSVVSSQTGDGLAKYRALRIGQMYVGYTYVRTPDCRSHYRMICIRGPGSIVQRHATAVRTGLLWLWAAKMDAAQLQRVVDDHEELVATSKQYLASPELASRVMAGEEVVKVAQQALKGWYGVVPMRNRKVA